MTNRELIQQLEKLPLDATIYRQDHEYRGAECPINKIEYRKDAGWGIEHNSILLRSY